MLSYYKQYHLSHSIFLTFQNPSKKVYSNHTQKIMDKYKNIFPYHKYETISENTFILTCLYVIYNYTPQSFNDMINKLRDIDKKDLGKFIFDIKMYSINIKKDLQFLRENYSDVFSYDLLLQLYLQNKIKFYTFYFLMMYLGYLDKLKSSRVYNIIYRKIKTIFVFVRLKQENINAIKNFIENELKCLI